MDYKYCRYLHSKWWKKRKEQALKAANYTCQICGSQVDLQVHHLNYENLGREKDNDLLVACEVCHIKRHEQLWGRSSGFLRRWRNCSVATAKEPLAQA